MSICNMCGKTYVMPTSGNGHQVCIDIKDERVRNNKCCRCGENPIKLGAGWLSCSDCGHYGKYRGY